MKRRDFLALSAAAPIAARGGLRSLREAARDAWLYALPLIEMAGARDEMLRRVAPNQLLGTTALTTVHTQSVTTPNNDTLYARAWIDLAPGPVTITLPPSGNRYLSVALMDMYTNNFALLGTRATGRDGAVVSLIGPQEPAGQPMTLRAPTRWVWLLARTLVDGETDLAAAVALQAQITLDAKPARVPASCVGRNAPWAAYFASAQALLNENPPPAADLGWLGRIEPVLAVGRRFDAAHFGVHEAAEIDAGVAEAKADLRGLRRNAAVTAGWVYPKPNLGDFGQDFLYRAQVAVGGLAALPPVEAMYMRALSPRGTTAFDSARDWCLHLPGGQLPPVNAFWSLTMYELTADGQAFFTSNPIDRYSIGDRTPGLARGAGGSLDIWMTRSNPGPERLPNWLPIPGDKPFAVTLRAYLPKDELLDGRYRLPPLQML